LLLFILFDGKVLSVTELDAKAYERKIDYFMADWNCGGGGGGGGLFAFG
jgi:hypothetical protein